MGDLEAFVGSSFLEPLAKLNEDGTTGPWLADSFTPNVTFDEWTLALRQDVTFQNGEPFNAEAVKANIDDAALRTALGHRLKGLITSTTSSTPPPSR